MPREASKGAKGWGWGESQPTNPNFKFKFLTEKVINNS